MKCSRIYRVAHTAPNILLVGQAPSRRTDGQAPFTGATGKRLAHLMGLSHEELLLLPAMNLFPSYPGSNGRGDKFPQREARDLAARISLSGYVAVLVGRSVARAFQFSHPHLTWAAFRGGMVASIPHPSGINSWYNDEHNMEQVREFFRRWRKESLWEKPAA